MPGDPERLPSFAVRKALDMSLPLSWGDLVSVGTLTPGAAAYLDAAVRARVGILVTGEPRTGRTIMLNVLGAATSYSSDTTYAVERLHCLTFPNFLPFAAGIQTVPAVDASGDTAGVRQAVRHLANMHPERVVVDDVVEDAPMEVWDLVRRCEGSMLSVVGRDPKSGLQRLLDLLSAQSQVDLRGDRLWHQETTEHIALIVHMAEPRDEAARVGQIYEVAYSYGERFWGQALYERTGKGELEWMERIATRTTVAISEGVPHLVPIRSAED